MSKKKKPKQAVPNAFDQTEQDEKLVERCKYVYDLVNGWIENTDNKIGVACGLFSGVFAVFTFLEENFYNKLDEQRICTILKNIRSVISTVSIFTMLIAVICLVLAIIPNIKSNAKENRGQKECPVFYMDISRLDAKIYRHRMLSASERDFTEELIWEIHHNSGVCKKKIKLYKAGVISAFMAIVLTISRYGLIFLMTIQLT